MVGDVENGILSMTIDEILFTWRQLAGRQQESGFLHFNLDSVENL